jgi:rhodanese-related sulfurtransferase
MVIDVRQPEEFSGPLGHLPGAVNVPLADVASQATALASRNRPIVLVCKTDRRSERATETLQAARLRDVWCFAAAGGDGRVWRWNNAPEPTVQDLFVISIGPSASVQKHACLQRRNVMADHLNIGGGLAVRLR